MFLPRHCQLTYNGESEPELLRLIEQVPDELWGARLALQVCILPECALQFLANPAVAATHVHPYAAM